MALPKFNEINEGFELPALTKEPIAKVQLVKYAGASGDFNQIHTVDEYAKEAGLNGVIAHGMLVMGILGQMVSSWAGIKNIKKYSVNFKAITKPGDILTAKGSVSRKYETEEGKFVDCKLQVEDQNGEVKVAGKCTIKFES